MTNFPAMIECRWRSDRGRESRPGGERGTDERRDGHKMEAETLWHSLGSDLSAGEGIMIHIAMVKGRNDEEQASIGQRALHTCTCANEL